MKKLVCLLFLLALVAPAQTAVPNRGQQWYTPLAYVPGTATNVVTATTFLDTVHLANTSAASVTCTFVDKSTNCGSSACQFWPTVTLGPVGGSGANPVILVQFNGIIATSGVQWSCSTASGVVGQLRGAYTHQ